MFIKINDNLERKIKNIISMNCIIDNYEYKKIFILINKYIIICRMK